MDLNVTYSDKGAKIWGAIVLVVIAMFIFSVYQCNERQELEVEKQNTSEYFESQIETYKDKLDREVSTRKSLVGDKDQLEVLLSKQVDSTEQFKYLAKKYKKIKAAGTVKTETVIKEVPVPFDRPLDLDFTRKFDVKHEYYSITGKVNNTGLNINDITIPNRFTFVMGKRKNGFLKPNSYSIDIQNSNPLITTKEADSYIFTPDLKRWTLGPYVGYDLFTGNISGGVSLQYGFIRF